MHRTPDSLFVSRSTEDVSSNLGDKRPASSFEFVSAPLSPGSRHSAGSRWRSRYCGRTVLLPQVLVRCRSIRPRRTRSSSAKSGYPPAVFHWFLTDTCRRSRAVRSCPPASLDRCMTRRGGDCTRSSGYASCPAVAPSRRFGCLVCCPAVCRPMQHLLSSMTRHTLPAEL